MTDLHTPYDMIGIGFGPSNLALAIALQECAAPLNALFLEAKPEFAWHPGMLLDNSDMQVSFIKDLVTLRNPASPFSFLSYLHAKGRIERFVNRKTFFPSRHEFNDYFTWAADQMQDVCVYDQRVEAVAPVQGNSGTVELLDVVTTDASGRESRRRTKDLVLAIGGAPNIPEAFANLRRNSAVLHSSSYVTQGKPKLASAEHPLRIAVIGSGQSGAEIFWDLVNDPAQPNVDLIFRGQALKPSDDSPFVNEIFDSAFTSDIYNRPKAVREAFLTEYAHTNYAVVDGDLIDQIYGVFYEQEVIGTEAHRLWRNTQVHSALAVDDGVELTLSQRGDVSRQRYDLVILATGYTRRLGDTILSDLAPWLTAEEAERSYQVPTRDGFQPRIFLQGYCEATHGLSDTLLSILPRRAEEITHRLISGNAPMQKALTAAE